MFNVKCRFSKKFYFALCDNLLFRHLCLRSYKSAAHAITIIDNAIDRVSTERAKLGAYLNRIEYNISNMRTAEENITAAESNIKDTDVAKEMMNLVQKQINLNAGSAMLAQANQTQETVLKLLNV